MSVLMPFMMANAHGINMLGRLVQWDEPWIVQQILDATITQIQIYRSSACGLVVKRTDRQRHLSSWIGLPVNWYLKWNETQFEHPTRPDGLVKVVRVWIFVKKTNENAAFFRIRKSQNARGSADRNLTRVFEGSGKDHRKELLSWCNLQAWIHTDLDDHSTRPEISELLQRETWGNT